MFRLSMAVSPARKTIKIGTVGDREEKIRLDVLSLNKLIL